MYAHTYAQRSPYIYSLLQYGVQTLVRNTEYQPLISTLSKDTLPFQKTDGKCQCHSHFPLDIHHSVVTAITSG